MVQLDDLLPLFQLSTSTHIIHSIAVLRFLQVLPTPSDASYLPPSYEEICNGAATNRGFYSSSTAIDLEGDRLPDYASVANQHSSMLLSTFYNEGSRPQSAVSNSKSVVVGDSMSVVINDSVSVETHRDHDPNDQLGSDSGLPDDVSRTDDVSGTDDTIDGTTELSREDFGVYVA